MAAKENLDLRSIMQDWYYKLWQERDLSVIEQYITPETSLHGYGDAPLCGREAFQALHRQFCDIFSQVKIVIEQAVVEGLSFSARNRVHLVHASTGKKVSACFFSMANFNSEGKVIEAWDNVDWYAVLVQLDALPSDAISQALNEERSFR